MRGVHFGAVGRAFLAILILTVWQIAGWPHIFHFSFGRKAAATPITLVLTSGTTWTVPPAWDSASNTVEAIGAGGSGAGSTASTNSGAGGGGGEYRKASNVTLTPSSTIDINIPSGGAGSSSDGAWLKNNSGTKVIEAMNGGNASGATAGAGGTGGTGSTANYDGGAGGAGATGAEGSGGGGGGSAGPTGIGKNGAGGAGGTNTGGGGGGGSNGGSSTAGSANSAKTGGDGGAGTSGSGGGSGGTNNSNNAGNGTSGGGGGGAGNSTGSTLAVGGTGGTEDLWDVGQGPSGGGGGGGGAGGTGRSGDASGGSGGTYGGGGGGAGFSGSHIASGGGAGQGIIIIIYTPSVSPSITQAAYRTYSNPSGIGTSPWQDCRTEGGETTIPSGSASSTVTPSTAISDTSQAFLLVNATGDSSVTAGSQHLVTGDITNSTTLTFTRGSAPSADTQVSYSLIECFRNEFSVQRGQTSIASGSSSNTASISSVDTSKSMVIVSQYDDDSSTNEQTGLATGELQDSTTVLVRRNNSPAVNDVVDWQVITFSTSSGASVQTGETSLISGSASVTDSITPVNTNESWLYCSYDADSNGLQQDAVGCDLTNSNTLTFNRNSSNAYINRIRWYAVTFPSGSVAVQRGTQSESGGSTDGVRYDTEISISAVSDLTKAFEYITNTTSGTGTAFPRNQWISQLTTTSNLETSYWRGSSNGSGNHYWQVVEFVTPDADVGTPLASQDASATLAASGKAFRLRMLLGVSAATLAQDTTFKLQYAALAGSCAASSYSDVTTSTAIAYHDIQELADKIPIVANANDPADGTNTTDLQTYAESNNITNSQSIISPGEDGEWDFSLADNSAPANTTYCFRMVHSSGSALDVYSVYPQITTSDGNFSTDIVNAGGTSVGSPTVGLSAAATSFNCATTTGTLGTSSERIRVTNHSSNPAWSLSIAATGGNTALWSSGTHYYDFNDPNGSPPGCSAGSDADSYAGLLGFDFSGASINPESGCSASGISSGSTANFNEGTTDSITLGSAGGSADNGCYWDFEGITANQAIPSGQPADNYSLNLTITLVAN